MCLEPDDDADKARDNYSRFLFVRRGLVISPQTYKKWFEYVVKKKTVNKILLSIQHYRHISNAWMERFCPADSQQIRLLYSKQAGRETSTAKNSYSSSNIDLEEINRIDFMENLSSSRSWQDFIGCSSVPDSMAEIKIRSSSKSFNSDVFERVYKQNMDRLVEITKQGFLNVYSLLESFRSGMPGMTFSLIFSHAESFRTGGEQQDKPVGRRARDSYLTTQFTKPAWRSECKIQINRTSIHAKGSPTWFQKLCIRFANGRREESLVSTPGVFEARFGFLYRDGSSQ